ncbi:MAG TPA: tetratricopeptide repeat protein [Pyrinomonadaceae bacterium]|jgi:DNA-binding winged helix-turn-helix (wHTH) protein/tetratricopeptide (TPR) repeat protein
MKSHKIKHFYEFGEFRLDAETPSLWRDGELVQIFPKALKVLVLLVVKQGDVVSREELMETVWRDAFVEESNITYTVSLLRKTLDENGKKNFIKTIPKRGYRFVADVREVVENGKAETAVSLASDAVDSIPIEQPKPQEPPKPPERLKAQEPPKAPEQPKAQIRWHFIGIILLGLLFVTSFAVWWSFGDQKGLSGVPVAQRNIRTVAILPLKTLTENEQSKALSLGLTDSLISRLGSLNRFAVRPLNSVKNYTETDKNPLKFGEELKVDAVLEGTLQIIENRLRVNLRLWDVRDGAQLWQDSFDSAEADFFNLQDTISTKVTQSLVSQLIEKDRELLTRRETENRDAFHAYWRGRFFLEKRNPAKAIAEFQQATNFDPDYAAPYTGLADAYIWQANFTSSADSELYAKAKTATDKALELDPNLADAHSSLGRIKYSHDWDWQGAENSFRQAIKLNPESVNAHQFYARLLATLGRYDEGLAEINKARRLDPRSADLGVPLFAILEKRGEFDEALKVLQATLEMDEDSQFARRGIGKIYLLKGDYAKVVALGNEMFPNPADTDFAWASMLATAYYKTGQTDKATRMWNHLKKMAEKDPKSLYFLAMHHSETGRLDEAFAALQKCLDLREERMIWTKDEPRFANLKDDSRFQEILRKMNLAG